MNFNPEPRSKIDNLSKILSAAKNFRRTGSNSTGMIFTDNWYDSHPRLLIFDPILNPYDKLVWLAIRSRCTPDMSMTSFPSYDEIQSMLKISRGTVSSSIAKLRMTRWTTLLCRDQERNEFGQFIRDGNIYMIHGEPLSLSDTFELDSNFMAYVNESRKHRNSDVRKIAELILQSLRHEISLGQNVMEYTHPFDRRADAWGAISGDTSKSFFGTYSNLDDDDASPSESESPKQESSSSSVVHETNYGKFKDLGLDQSEKSVRVDSVVPTGSKKVVKNNYNKLIDGARQNELDSELVFPENITANQKHLIELHLRRLPDQLPPPPKPWNCWHQLLLDELDGRIKAGLANKCSPVWNPVSLMAVYCKRLIENGTGLREDGQFQIENAERVYAQRDEEDSHQDLFEKTRSNYRQRTLEHAMKRKQDSD